jgi:hypothetical protein
MATLKLPFALEKPSASIGVCDVTEIWDSVNSQWLSVTVAGGGGATYTAGDGISISSGNVISASSATNAAKGTVQLSDSTTIATDLTNQNDTKAVTPKALASAMSTTISTAVATEVSGKFVVTTKAAYDLLTPDANKFYFCTEN